MAWFARLRQRRGSDAALRTQLVADLEQAGFVVAEINAVCHTPAMWRQAVQFYRQGGRVVMQPASFSAANGAPQQITIYLPEDPALRDCSDYATLAHELGHALSCPEQWKEPAEFASAEAYARAREMGEAHAWLNQYRLCMARTNVASPPQCVLTIENDDDFGSRPVDVFARIHAMQQQGAPEQAILDDLATLNANMFPCGMGENNFKTYGQCNRWNWLAATQHGALQQFLDLLARPIAANEQKLLMKFNQFTGAPPQAGDGALPAGLQQLACGLRALPQTCSLHDLYQCGAEALPEAQLGLGRHSCRRTS